MSIRRARHSDLEQLVEIERACFGRHQSYAQHQFDEQQFCRCLDNSNITVFVTGQGVEITGYAAVQFGTGIRARSARLIGIAVCPECRLQGLGAALIKRVFREACSRQRERLWLEVAANNPGGERLFAANGFKRARNLPHYYGRGQHARRMMRSLL